MVTKMKKMGVLLCAACLVFANGLTAYAGEPGRQEEPVQVQEEVILPPTQQSYIAYLFDLSLPTCVGSGEYKLSQHYFDPVLEYGYPPSMKFSMSTSGICDFGAHVWAEDLLGEFYELSGGSSQSHGMVAERTFQSPNTILRGVNDSIHPSTAWVCDDEDYGECYNLHVVQK